MEKTNSSKCSITPEFWSYEKLSKLEPVCINRNTEIRLEKVYKRLKQKYIETHSVFTVGRATKSFDPYKKNDMFVLDGNTRLEIYKINPDLIPEKLLVLIIDVDNWEDLKSLYYSIDNSEAAETSSEKITGIFRLLSFDPITKTIKNGSIKKAIDFVTKNDIDSNGVRINKYPLEEQIKRYVDVLTTIDTTGVTTTKVKSAGVTACLIMVGMKYGFNNERFILLCNNLKWGLASHNDEKQIDGVFYVYDTLYNYYGKDFWTNYGVFTVNKSPIVIRTLYGFDMFMKNINIDKNKKLESPLKWKTSENIVPKSLENLFKNYLKKEELEEVEI
jgi:hypothetical protein